MPTTPKTLGHATLTNVLTDIYVCPAATTTRAEHIGIAVGPTAGTLTLRQFFAASGLTRNIMLACPVDANKPYEYFNVILEAGDKIQGSSTVDADLIIWGTEQS